ncbi:hypothetical protein ACOMHN_002693 [Nucella lapillus]
MQGSQVLTSMVQSLAPEVRMMENHFECPLEDGWILIELSMEGSYGGPGPLAGATSPNTDLTPLPSVSSNTDLTPLPFPMFQVTDLIPLPSVSSNTDLIPLPSFSSNTDLIPLPSVSSNTDLINCPFCFQ